MKFFVILFALFTTILHNSVAENDLKLQPFQVYRCLVICNYEEFNCPDITKENCEGIYVAPNSGCNCCAECL